MTPDVNILVAASRSDHPHHRPAIHWLEKSLKSSSPGQQLVLLPMVASGFLRLVTHPKIFVKPTPIKDAKAFVRAILDSPGVELISLGKEWPVFEQLCEEYQLTGNDIPDAWIAAATQINHLHLATFDKSFKRYLKPSMLTILTP